jgi:hypothetical protein
VNDNLEIESRRDDPELAERGRLNLAQDASPISANLSQTIEIREDAVFHISNSPQKRHPERSASPDLSRDTAVDGAEPKDPEGAYLAHAVRTFSTTEARTWRTHGLFPRAENKNC